ncbi:MAG: PQQ-binding-like beta-propeller repeat protein [Thermoguttaceae bacterium]
MNHQSTLSPATLPTRCYNPAMKIFNTTLSFAVCILMVTFVNVAHADTHTNDASWPQFLGPNGDGRADANATPPLNWSEENAVRFKIPISGRGWASPVVAGGLVWLANATDDGTELYAIAVSTKDGSVVHDKKILNVAVPQPRHPTNSYASPTPIIAGERIVFTFGYAGTVCLNTSSGETLWERRDLECDHHKNAAGGSPVVYVDEVNQRTLVIFSMDGTEDQYIIALDIATGDTVWRVRRDFDYASLATDFRKAYGTPTLATIGGRGVVIAPAAQRTWCYEAATGNAVWSFAYDGGFSNAVRPLLWRDRVILNSGFTPAKMFCIPLDSKGVVGDDAIDWIVEKNVTLIPKPLIFSDGNFCVMVDGGGIVTCLDLETGDVLWTHRLAGNYWASPIAAAGRIYFFSEQETTTVAEVDRIELRVLATNTLDDGCMATPAFIGKTIWMRTKTHLYAIE